MNGVAHVSFVARSATNARTRDRLPCRLRCMKQQCCSVQEERNKLLEYGLEAPFFILNARTIKV